MILLLSELCSDRHPDLPFSGIEVSQAAFTFIYRFMSNKSAEYPSGVLNREVLKSFMSITGPDNALKWVPGNEKIPSEHQVIPSFPGQCADICVRQLVQAQPFRRVLCAVFRVGYSVLRLDRSTSLGHRL